MTPNEWLLDETRGWIERAQGDLRAAEICAPELPATALFHCQQAAEKYLKAYLTWNQKVFRKTHELRELVAACALIDPSLKSTLDPTRLYRSTPGNFGTRERLMSRTPRKRRPAALSRNK